MLTHPLAAWSYLGSFAYAYNATNATQPQARTYCQSLGADLPSVLSSAENLFLFNFQPFDNAVKWLGGRRNRSITPVSPSAFTWADGLPWGFVAFQPGEPNDLQGAEGCVQMGHRLSRTAVGFWNDAPCTNRNFILCKRPGDMFNLVYLSRITHLRCA